MLTPYIPPTVEQKYFSQETGIVPHVANTIDLINLDDATPLPTGFGIGGAILDPKEIKGLSSQAKIIYLWWGVGILGAVVVTLGILYAKEKKRNAKEQNAEKEMKNLDEVISPKQVDAPLFQSTVPNSPSIQSQIRLLPLKKLFKSSALTPMAEHEVDPFAGWKITYPNPNPFLPRQK